MLSLLRRRRDRIATAAGFRAFTAGQGALVSQKCTIEYCRARAGMNWDKLYKEAAFRAPLEICRWDAFAAVLADVAVVAEGYLRPAAGHRTALLADALAADFAASLAEYPLPAHRPQGWGEECATLRRRLAAAQLAAPEAVHRVGGTAGDRIFAVLPIHPSLRTHDRELIRNNVRFGLCRTYEDMERQVDAAAVAADMLARTTADGAANAAADPI